MTSTTNRRIVLARRPEGALSLDCFRLEEAPLEEAGDGRVLVETEHLSIDAFIRTVLYEQSFHEPVPIGATLSAMGVGRVIESGAPGFAPGDSVFGPLGAQTHSAMPGFLFQKVAAEGVPLRAHLGILGLTTGFTAYFGIRDVGAVQPGETVVVSAAAGAVGSVAAQLARLEGARVIGIAGGPEKARFLTGELGLDAAIDYKGEDVDARLRELAPDGIDVYFDNVGGELLDVALDQIRERGRVVICGAISQYDHMDSVRGPSLYLRLAERHARMEGFAVTHFVDRFKEAHEQLGRWLAEGKLHMHEHVVHGIENFPAALLMLFEGGHMGKLLVEV